MQLHNLLADCARELSKPSKDLAGLLVRTEKKFLVLGFVFFYGCHCKWGRFLSILAQVAWP